MTGLQSLNLSGTQLTALPPEIGQMTGLQSLKPQRHPTDGSAA